MADLSPTLALLRALKVRDVATVLGVAATAALVVGVLSDPGRTMSLDADLGFPILLAGALMALAAWLLWLTAGGAWTARQRRAWKVLAVVVAVVAAEQATSLHERIADWTDAAAAVAAAPTVALALAALLLAARVGDAVVRPALVGALALWAAAQVLDALGEGGTPASAALELTAAPLAGLAALAAVQRNRPGAGDDPPAKIATRAVLLRADAGRLAIVLAAMLAAVLVGGVLYHSDLLALQSFDMRSEQSVPEMLSVTLLATAGALALLRSRLSSAPWHAWALLGIALLAMSVDDLIAGHEGLGDITGVKGQIVLLPLVALAGIGWLSSLRRSEGGIARLLIAGAAAWVASQAIDVVQPGGVFHWTVVPEEMLELAGSSLFVLALLLAVQGTVPPDRASEGGTDASRPRAVAAGS